MLDQSRDSTLTQCQRFENVYTGLVPLLPNFLNGSHQEIFSNTEPSSEFLVLQTGILLCDPSGSISVDDHLQITQLAVLEIADPIRKKVIK